MAWSHSDIPAHMAALLHDHPLAKVRRTSIFKPLVTPSWSSLWCEGGGLHQVLSASSLMGFHAYPFRLTPCTEAGSEDVCRHVCQFGFPLLIMNLLVSYFTLLKPSRLVKKLQLGYVPIKYV